MTELKSLTLEQLKDLHLLVKEMRFKVNDLVDSYGYTASALVSRTFEHDIEQEFGRKYLKENSK